MSDGFSLYASALVGGTLGLFVLISSSMSPSALTSLLPMMMSPLPSLEVEVRDLNYASFWCVDSTIAFPFGRSPGQVGLLLGWGVD